MAEAVAEAVAEAAVEEMDGIDWLAGEKEFSWRKRETDLVPPRGKNNSGREGEGELRWKGEGWKAMKRVEDSGWKMHAWRWKSGSGDMFLPSPTFK